MFWLLMQHSGRLPDKILFVDQIPKTGTGKFDKKMVRSEYADLLME